MKSTAALRLPPPLDAGGSRLPVPAKRSGRPASASAITVFPPDPDLVTAKELAAELRAPLSSIYMWERIQVLPSVRIGGVLRFSLSTVMPLLEANTRGKLKPWKSLSARPDAAAPESSVQPAPWPAPSRTVRPQPRKENSVVMAAFDPAEIGLKVLTPLMSVCSQLHLVPLITEAAKPGRIAGHAADVKLVVLSARQVADTLGMLLKVYADSDLELPVIVVVMAPGRFKAVMNSLPSGVPVILCPPVWTEACHNAVTRALVAARAAA